MSTEEGEKKFEGTMVDLGEDLLAESTRAIAPPAARPTTPESKPKGQPSVPSQTSEGDSLQDEVQKGEIFFAEKLFEDAKKVFRKVLRRDPNNAVAKKFLDAIQKLEIQALLGGEAPRKRFGINDGTEDDTPSKVLEQLEKELRISFEKGEIKPVPDLFDSDSAFDRYRQRVLSVVDELPARDRLDMGVAHLEMGLYDIAQSIFESVVRYEEFKLQGMYLLGLALIFGGKAIEATIRLEPLCRDLTLGEGLKTDYLYLMGLAFERLHDTRKAREFYRRVYLLNPRYRDVIDKLK